MSRYPNCKNQDCNNRNDAKPCKPVRHIRDWYRIEVVITRNVDWSKEQVKIFEECTAGREFPLNPSHVSVTVLRNIGDTDSMQN